MEDLFLQELAFYIEARIKMEMLVPKDRYTKIGNMRKPLRNPFKYNTKASGRLYNSVETKVIDGLIYILMADYGVENVYSDLADSDSGSFPGGGRFHPDTRTQKGSFSPLLAALEKWIIQKRIPTTNPRGMAFAVRTNLFKYGWAGIPLITDKVRQDIFNKAVQLLQDPKYQGFVIKDVLDRFQLIGKTSAQFNLNI
jgi:hypothetical protein